MLYQVKFLNGSSSNNCTALTALVPVEDTSSHEAIKGQIFSFLFQKFHRYQGGSDFEIISFKPYQGTFGMLGEKEEKNVI